MVRCDRVIQNCQIILLSCFIKPREPTMTVFRKFEQKILFVTPVVKMPNLTRNILSFPSCHGWFPAIIPFLTIKTTIQTENRVLFSSYFNHSKLLAWPDPLCRTKNDFWEALGKYVLAEIQQLPFVQQKTPFKIYRHFLRYLRHSLFVETTNNNAVRST